VATLTAVEPVLAGPKPDTILVGALNLPRSTKVKPRTHVSAAKILQGSPQMPSLAQHQSNNYIKALLVGNAKTGKTGSLVSLVKAGYKLRILDMDNLLDILKYMIVNECPENLDNVEFRTIRDKYKPSPAGPIIAGTPKAWAEAVKMLDRWKYDDTDLGIPGEWGSDCILVIDSLSRLCDAAYDWHETMIPRGKSGDFDGRAVYGNAQDAVEKVLALLTSDSMQTNIIVIAHVAFQQQPDGSLKGLPQGVGKALSPKIPSYFSTVLLYSSHGDKRTINTTSTALMDLCTPAPLKIAKTYPIDTGLAEIFGQLRPAPAALSKTISPRKL